MDEDTTPAPASPGAVGERPVAHPIDGWSNWVTFHDICRTCGRRITGFVCDSGRLTRLDGDRWSVVMRWQHDGEGEVACEPDRVRSVPWAGVARGRPD